jgi:serine/threonine-protein kinase
MPKSCPRCHRPIEAAWKFCPFDGFEIVDDGANQEAGDTPPIGEYPGFSPRATRFTGAVVGGRYRIVGFVNKGATARVYLAEDLESRDIVAVKLFAPTVREAAAMRERFLREAEALRAIDHPNVVRVLDAGELDGAPYLVMEALRGETLAAVLERTPILPDDVALRYVREAASALAAAHRTGVIHRDVKPENMFLVRNGDEVTLKVIDFGMAKVPRDGTSSVEGLVMGTVQYMAPEQIISEPVDARTDIYALGVVLFRMLTGHLPFDVEMGTDLLGHQLFSPAPPPSWLDDDLDPNVERVILCAMRKDPDNRYPTMECFLEDLARERAEGWPMMRQPDVYEPMTDPGREAAKFLSTQFRRP